MGDMIKILIVTNSDSLELVRNYIDSGDILRTIDVEVINFVDFYGIETDRYSMVLVCLEKVSDVLQYVKLHKADCEHVIHIIEMTGMLRRVALNRKIFYLPNMLMETVSGVLDAISVNQSNVVSLDCNDFINLVKCTDVLCQCARGDKTTVVFNIAHRWLRKKRLVSCLLYLKGDFSFQDVLDICDIMSPTSEEIFLFGCKCEESLNLEDFSLWKIE